MSTLSGLHSDRGRWFAAIGVMYCFRLGAGALLALPVRYAVGASGMLQFPAGDRALYAPGGLYLLEGLAAERALIAASAGPTLWLFGALAVAALFPEYLLLRALGTPEPDRSASGGRQLLRMACIALGLLPLRLLALGMTLAFAWTAHSWFGTFRDVRVADAAFLVVLALGLVAQLGAAMWRDLAVSAVVVRGSRIADAVRIAGAAFRGPGLGARYAAALGAGCAAYAAVAALVSALDMSRAGAARALAVVALQQAAVLAAVLFRAGWLKSAAAAAGSARRAFPSDGAPPHADAFL